MLDLGVTSTRATMRLDVGLMNDGVGKVGTSGLNSADLGSKSVSLWIELRNEGLFFREKNFSNRSNLDSSLSLPTAIVVSRMLSEVL